MIRGAIHGIHVAEVTQMAAGPVATRMLGCVASGKPLFTTRESVIENQHAQVVSTSRRATLSVKGR